MKLKLYLPLFASLIFFISVSAQQGKLKNSLPENASDSWFANASSYIKELEYNFHHTGDNSFRVSNPANHTSFIINKKGYTASSMDDGSSKDNWSADFILQSVSRNSSITSFSATGSFEKKEQVLLQHAGIADIEYINNEKGLRQNFIIQQRLEGNTELRVNIKIRTALSLRLVNQAKLVCYTRGQEESIKLEYEDLKVWDASKRILPSYMQLNEKTGLLSLVVDDKDAVYPITVDPLNKIPEWTTSADGILPALLTSVQVQALYGYSVIGLGDIDNDGNDDVAVSAPGMADVFSGSGSLLSVGAVFIYLGDSLGLPAMPSKILQPSSAVAGALFGLSMAAGNISADGINDLLISAPLDRYTTTAAALPFNVSVSVTAGKVYYYRSEDLFSAANPSPTVQIRLQGTTHFSTGVLGLLASNVTAKALFGFSVAVADDLNGDNRQDVIIGTPAYLGTGLLDIQSGAAFVYYSDNLSTTAPVELAVPTPSVLGLITLPVLNLNGLLFGFSVEGVGDYNNDGFSDVVVGAPAGVDLSSLGGIFSGQVLGGSAYVYYGNGGGVNPAIGASLQASPSGLLSNAANLFGYRIKGVKNAAGARNGNILVSAPSGAVLSNLVGGLRLKAGQVHVFKKKVVAFASPVLSDQALSSPRSSSVLSLLTGQNLNISMLYGAGTDNLQDINCDGHSDIIVGEPLSTNVPIIGANINGGAAYVYLGKPDGTYQATPVWNTTTTVSSLLGVNATSLVGFSVAGAGHTQGASQHIRAIIGGPTNTLDFGAGLLNLGNTVGTLYNFAFDNNGLGKSYVYDMGLCGFVTLPTTLVSFSGHRENKIVQLDWVSVVETQVNMYELQRSTDGVNFTTIAVVFAKGAQRNEYNYPDRQPHTGVNYYRLRVVDTDGKFVYSNIINVRFDGKQPGLLVVTPNPVREDIRIRFTGYSKGAYSLKLYNTGGQLLQVKKLNLSIADQTEIMPRGKNMPAGIYWLGVYDENDKKIGTVRLLLSEL